MSHEASIDWCCLRRFDADPLFCRLLDAGKGGFCSIQPAGDAEWSRQYAGPTAILETTCRTRTGTARIVDFMPVGRKAGAGVHDYVTLRAPFRLVRIVDGIEGTVEMRAVWRPSVEFARRPAAIQAIDRGAEADGWPALYTDVELHAGLELAERTLDHLEGYRGSATVRAGNGAWEQEQLDVYGEVLDWGIHLRRARRAHGA